MIEKEYDVVIDVLVKHKNILQKMVNQNIEHDMFNIMDQIRLEQISSIDECISLWSNKHVYG